MRLIKARVQGYRSIIDSGYFDVEQMKTIFVGPNEAGKSALLQALQKLNPPVGTAGFDPLRDYPRSKYDEDIECKKVDPSRFTVVEGHFVLSDDEKETVPAEYRDLVYVHGKYLDNHSWHRLDNAPNKLTYGAIEKDILRLASHMESNANDGETNGVPSPISAKIRKDITTVITPLTSSTAITADTATQFTNWLNVNLAYITENGQDEKRFDTLKILLAAPALRKSILEQCGLLLPTFILFNNYFRIHPSIHLSNLVQRIEQKLLDDDQYDYGNVCLLKFLGFTAKELSQTGVASPVNNNPAEIQKYKDTLDRRDYRLNAASIRLSDEICRIWNPNLDKGEASKLRIKADGQYLKVVVEDELGVEVELNQRSEGFQWLVSFLVVFFSEAADEHKNAILLLDEPGMSLHGLKQVEFRETLTRLSESNQTIFTTHSPFLVGSNELDLVRVVEMMTRRQGTLVHTTVAAVDSAALLPLQEALGYDLAQSLFFQQKNLVLEGLTDYWYIEAISELLSFDKKLSLDSKIAMIPANCAGKVVYYATMLHAQNLKVVALLDSDTEGDLAAQQDTLVNALGNKNIIRTKDVYNGRVKTPEIEDLLRDTLISVAESSLGWRISQKAEQQVGRPIVDIMRDSEKGDFSKYRLAKSFLRWARDAEFTDLTQDEQTSCKALLDKINKALK